MSVVVPTIDDLLSVTNENRFLLCEMAARRACDINDMMRNQHNRAEQLASVEDVAMFLSSEDGSVPNPLSIAFDEIAPRADEDGNMGEGLLSFVKPNVKSLSEEPVIAVDEILVDIELPEEANAESEATETAEDEPAVEATSDLLGE